MEFTGSLSKKSILTLKKPVRHITLWIQFRFVYIVVLQDEDDSIVVSRIKDAYSICKVLCFTRFRVEAQSEQSSRVQGIGGQGSRGEKS